MGKKPRPKRTFVVDMDLTIVGNVRLLAQKYRIAQIAENNGLIPDFETYIRPWMVESMRGFIRPHFGEFLAKAAKKGHRVFVYTSSTPEWAHYAVGLIEEVVGLQVMRPIFSRDDTESVVNSVNRFQKRIDLILPRMEAAVGSKIDLATVTIIDDDMSVWHQRTIAPCTIIQCPKFSYEAFLDPFDGFFPMVLNHATIGLFAQQNSLYNPGAGYVDRYRWCEQTLKNMERDNMWLKGDTFWLKVIVCGGTKCPVDDL